MGQETKIVSVKVEEKREKEQEGSMSNACTLSMSTYCKSECVAVASDSLSAPAACEAGTGQAVLGVLWKIVCQESGNLNRPCLFYWGLHFGPEKPICYERNL